MFAPQGYERGLVGVRAPHKGKLEKKTKIKNKWEVGAIFAPRAQHVRVPDIFLSTIVY